MACPICTRETDPKYRPFCSRRCADIDLAKWLTGSYAIPSTDPEDAEDLDREMDAARRDAPPDRPH